MQPVSWSFNKIHIRVKVNISFVWWNPYRHFRTWWKHEALVQTFYHNFRMRIKQKNWWTVALPEDTAGWRDARNRSTSHESEFWFCFGFFIWEKMFHLVTLVIIHVWVFVPFSLPECQKSAKSRTQPWLKSSNILKEWHECNGAHFLQVYFVTFYRCELYK